MFSFRDLFEASYKGNIGIMELVAFYKKAGNEDPALLKKVKKMISDGGNEKAVWKIVQDFLNVQLVDK